MPFTYIVKNSTLGGKVPSAAQLQPGELALNLTDQKLYSKDVGGTVFEIGKPEELDKGPTSQRPPTPIQGDLYYDTDINTLLYWDGTEWVEMGRVKVDLLYQPNGNNAGVVTNTAGNNATIPIATNSVAGLFTGTEKQKLQGISTGADVANDNRITITKDNVPVGSFTVNQNFDHTINIPADATSGVTSISEGTNISVSPASGVGAVTISASNDYNDLVNTPTVGEGEITIKQGGVEIGKFNVNQTTPEEINIAAPSSGGPGGTAGVTQIVQGDGIEVSPSSGEGVVTVKNTKPASDAEITIKQGSNEVGKFKLNQTNNDTFTLTDYSGAFTDAETPLSKEGTNKIKLNYSKGLHVVNDKLEVYLGSGLDFDGDKIKVDFPNNAIQTYKPFAKVTSGADEERWDSAGVNTPSSSKMKQIEFDNIPNEVDGFITITTFRCIMRINDSTTYPTPLAVARMVGDFYCKAVGRGVNCQTSGESDSIGLILGSTIAFGGGPGNQNTAWEQYLYGTRVDEWTCNTGSDRVRFEFRARNVNHNKVKISFNGGCRVALIPYDR